MDYTKVTIYTTSEGIDPILGRLLNVGIDSTMVEDEEEFKNFLEETRDSWDYVDDELMEKMNQETKVSFFLELGDFDTVSAAKNEILALKSIDKDGTYGKLSVEVQDVVGEDWMNNWKQYFHTMEIGDDLIVKPYWEDVNSGNKKVFEINPGLSFGTGTHHTTKMCIEDIITTVKNGDEVLDLGCGSGILSIISLLYGAKNALAVDIDENSYKTAYENLDRNGLNKDNYLVIIGNILSDKKLQDEICQKKYDVILANIVADVIISSLPIVKKALKNDGIFITSGIIEDRIEEVKEKIILEGFEIINEKRSANWAEFKCRLA